jgi:hypothetical protein
VAISSFRNRTSSVVSFSPGRCLHRQYCAETKTSGVTSLRIAFLNHYHSQNAQSRCGNLLLQKQNVKCSVIFPWSLSSPAKLCRNKNIRCNVIANRLPQSLSFPKCSKAMWQSPPSETEAPFITSLAGTK